MKNTQNFIIEIDGLPRTPGRMRRRIALTFMSLAILGVLSLAVWFLGFSEWGFSWSGNTAKYLSEDPANVIISYPSVSVMLDESTLMLVPGDTYKLKASLKKEKNARDLDMRSVRLKWISQHPSVATVDYRGVIRALRPGTATIYVAVANNNVDASPVTCLVTVRSWNSDSEEDTGDANAKTLPSE